MSIDRLRKLLEDNLAKLKQADGITPMLNKDDVNLLVYKPDDEDLKFYYSWFHKVADLAEWMGMMYTRTSFRKKFPSKSEIMEFRMNMVHGLGEENVKESPREVSEYMAFFTLCQVVSMKSVS